MKSYDLPGFQRLGTALMTVAAGRTALRLQRSNHGTSSVLQASPQVDYRDDLAAQIHETPDRL
ncbi:MAG: hypothetical protein O3A00_15890, partial [Planctomycetota bacterium]|nr:hypothetical protein [Planctomycetota bacterium]